MLANRSRVIELAIDATNGIAVSCTNGPTIPRSEPLPFTQ